jgi:hypothetical protein
MKYPQYVIDYAIDNKISLEEAYELFIIKGKETENDPKNGIDIEAEEKYLSELEQDIKNQSAEDEQWWAAWKDKMKKIEDMEQELDIVRSGEPITKEDMDWVEAELKECDKLYDKLYGKDV